MAGSTFSIERMEAEQYAQYREGHHHNGQVTRSLNSQNGQTIEVEFHGGFLSFFEIGSMITNIQSPRLQNWLQKIKKTACRAVLSSAENLLLELFE
jgi:hypothetical protein